MIKLQRMEIWFANEVNSFSLWLCIHLANRCEFENNKKERKKITVHKSYDAELKRRTWKHKNHWNRTQTVFIFDLFELTITMGFYWHKSNVKKRNGRWSYKAAAVAAAAATVISNT